MKSAIKIKIIIIVLIFFCTGYVQAQYYLTGQDPASVRWTQIKTGDIQLVFPKGYDSIARYYANILEMSNPYVRKPYLKTQPRLTIILHNQSVTSNAMVSPAPFHADFFEMPGQLTYAQIWQKQLALHEYRHAVQMSKINQGIAKILLGQQGTAALFGTMLPFWFIEGDAVYSETIHSKSGRGRVPDFVYPLKAQILDKKIYPYDKAQFGSYRDFVPDHYTLGYQLVLQGIEQHGIGMWNDVLNRVARKFYTLIPFTHGLKKNTGFGKVRFYKNSMKNLQSRWRQNYRNVKPDTADIISPKQRFYTSWLFAQPIGEGKFIAEKTSIDDINRFVLIDKNGNEKRLFTPGFDFRESLSANDSLICWNEKTFDPRWSNRDYSVIKIFNYKTKELRQITRRSRYFAPAISPDSHQIVTVRVDSAGNNYLDFLSSRDGHLIQSFYTKDNLFFMQPSWSRDGKRVVVTVLGDKGKSLLLLNTNNLTSHFIQPFSFSDISHPVIYKNWVVYTGTYEGKDNLYAINIQDQKTYRLFNARYGAKDATFSKDGSRIYFSNYTSNGFKPAVISFSANTLTPFNSAKKHFEYPIDKLVKPNTFILDDSIIPQKHYPEKKYSRIGHLFNPYSWGSFFIDASSYNITPGISILSQNKLSTAVSTAAYLWNWNENTGKVRLTFDYYGWYPVIRTSVSYGHRRIYRTNDSGEKVEYRWKETNLNINIKVPLSYARGKWLRGFQPSVSYGEKFLRTFPGAKFELTENSLTTFSYQLYGYNQYKRSAKDLYPKWGQAFNLVYRHTPLSASPSRQFVFESWFYLPGFVRHQGLRLYLAFQKQTEGNYRFSDLIFTPRAYENLYDSQMKILSVDYAFPLAYPDLDWQGVAYLKRLYAHLFYDYMVTGKGSHYRSSGIELYSDWNFLSSFPDISLGVRWSYTKEKTNRFELLYSIRF